MKKIRLHRVRNEIVISRVKAAVLMLFILVQLNLFGQMNYFMMPPFKVDVNSGSTSFTSINSSTIGKYYMSNGAFDMAGNLLFYVQDNGVYDNSGTAVGSLPSNTALWTGEIGIVPVPGECKKFYVIYSDVNGNMHEILYVIVDCTSSSPVIVTNSGSAWSLGFTVGGGTGFAISKKINSGVSSIYNLYFFSGPQPSRILYAQISSSGINPGADIGYNTIIESRGDVELEVSANGNYLAYSNNTGDVVWIDLVTTSSSGDKAWGGSETVKNYSGNRIIGLEFVGSGTPDLYVAGPGIFDKYNCGTGAKTSISTGLYNFDHTHIEYTKAGNIVGICDYSGGRFLAEYNIGTPGMSVKNINMTGRIIEPIASNASGGINPTWTSWDTYPEIYTLPLQIDGEDYTNFSGMPFVTLAGMNINNVPAGNVCNPFQQVYQCEPILLDADFEGGTPCKVNLELISVNESCEQQSGINYFNYSGSLLNAVGANGNISGFDMADVHDDYEQSLTNRPGKYLAILTIEDCCGNQSQQFAAIEVLEKIQSPIGMQIYKHVGTPGFVNPGTTIGTAVNVGAASLAYVITNYNGSITEVNVYIEEVDNTGSVLSVIANQTFPWSTAQIGLSGINLNNICVDASKWTVSTSAGSPCSPLLPSPYSGYEGWFSNHGILIPSAGFVGRYFKLKVTLSNKCSSAYDWTYLKIDAQSLKSQLLGIDNASTAPFETRLYPNPAANYVDIKINSDYASDAILTIYDVSGRELTKFSSSKQIVIGENNLRLNIEDLSEGMYTYKIVSGSNSKSGSLSIIR